MALTLAVPALAFATTNGAAATVAKPAPATTIAQTPQLRVQDAGRAPATTRVDIAVALNYRDEPGLEALIHATSDPASPEYGHFLTPGQFAAQFAPSAADYDAVVASLVRAGFTITKVSAGRTIVNASAPAAVVERYFGTVIHTVRQSGVAGARYANATPAYAPPGVKAHIYGVAGLNNLIVAKTQNVRAAARHIDAALGPPLQGPDTGLSPFAIASAYDFPVQHVRPGATNGATFDGTGRAAGIAIDSDLLDSDVAAYLAYFNVKRSGPPLRRVNVDGGSGGINGDSVETTLDVETIAGLAPGAAVYLYLMPSLSTLNIVDTYAQVVADNKVDVLDSSFGGCEIGDNFATLSDHIAMQGAAQGITFSASSGDFGAQTCLFVTPDNLGVSAPASGSHFTAVGGTSLLITPSAVYKREFAWNGSGGGVSTIFNLPTYQKGIKNVLGTTRNVPDIAFDADPGTGESFYYTGLFQGPIGGTSLASPIFSALVAEFNETTGKRAGAINTAIYNAFKAQGYGIRFRDITIGNNSFFGPGYNALAGYDEVTGIGSVIGTAHAK